jgi:hypothetical protein
MMVDLAPGWKTELDRGPDWLFVKLLGPDSDGADASGIAESIYLLMHQEFVRRLVLELDELLSLPQDLVDELFVLREMIDGEGGMLRLCGLHYDHRDALAERDFCHRFTPFRNREEAVLGFYRPNRPR